jgi:hypothetical protein
MAAYAILVGLKSGKSTSIIIDEPSLVKLAFKDEVAKGSACKFDSIELVDTRQGRIKRWRNTKPVLEASSAKSK